MIFFVTIYIYIIYISYKIIMRSNSLSKFNLLNFNNNTSFKDSSIEHETIGIFNYCFSDF